MTGTEDGQSVPTTTSSTAPKKRFIGKARAEALRRQKAAEQASSGPNIEDGVIATRSPLPPRGGRVANQIPAEILEDKALNEAIKIVSPHTKEITKT